MWSRRHQIPGSGLRPAAIVLRPGIRLVLLALVALLGLSGRVAAQQAGALLAPPGECATKRVDFAGLIDPEFSIVGPVAALLDPIDVSGSPPAIVRPPPRVLGIARPGPCDSPASGCNPDPVASGPAGTPPAHPPVQGGVRPTPNPPVSGGTRPPASGSAP